MTSKNSLHQCLLQAILHYDDSLIEEQGGFILRKSNSDEYKFIPIRNQNTGTPIAVGLYIADTAEFNEKVALPTLDDEWEVYASYHTHPVGMRALPSHTDLTKLFTSFPRNYIYAPGKELNKFTYRNLGGALLDGDLWHFENVMTFNGFNPDREARRNKPSWLECENT